MCVACPIGMRFAVNILRFAVVSMGISSFRFSFFGFIGTLLRFWDHLIYSLGSKWQRRITKFARRIAVGGRQREEIYQTLRRITDPLHRSWAKLEKAERIVIKFNMMKPHNRIIYYMGRRRELVDDMVARAVLRLLRERTRADLIATDTNPYTREHLMGGDFNYAHILKEYDVAFVDSNAPPFAMYEVPGGGCMFDRYTLSACFEGAEVVSVAKMKNHLFMGITLCMKNLFGLPPITLPHGRVRTYYHHFIRLSYVLPDLGLIARPRLNIIDALTGQWGREWGGQGRVCNALIAGDHVTATDACAAYLMGHNPASDWPTPAVSSGSQPPVNRGQARFWHGRSE